MNNMRADRFIVNNPDFHANANTTECSSECSAETECIATINEDGKCTNYHSNEYSKYLDGSKDWDKPNLFDGKGSSICGPIVEGFK